MVEERIIKDVKEALEAKTNCEWDISVVKNSSGHIYTRVVKNQHKVAVSLALEDYLAQESPEKIADEIIKDDTMWESKIPPELREFNMSLEEAIVPGNVYPCLLNRFFNEGILEDIPYRELIPGKKSDIVAALYAFPIKDNYDISILIKNEILEALHMDADTIWKAALENLHEARIFYDPINSYGDEEEDAITMVGRERGFGDVWGSSAILSPDFAEEVFEKYGECYVTIPSSMFLAIIPTNSKYDLTDLILTNISTMQESPRSCPGISVFEVSEDGLNFADNFAEDCAKICVSLIRNS